MEKQPEVPETGPDLDPEVRPWRDYAPEMAEDQYPPEPLITLE